MRIVMTIVGGLLAVAAAQPAAALRAWPGAAHSYVVADGKALHEVVRVSHRLWQRVPTSPYYSYGYPRLYYHPWGVRPLARRWRHP